MKRTRSSSLLKPEPSSSKIAKTIANPQNSSIKCCMEQCKSEKEEFSTEEKFLQHFVGFHFFDPLKKNEFEELTSQILTSLLKCPTCKSASFKTLKTFMWHYGFKHEISIVLNYVKKECTRAQQIFECPLCDYQSESKTTMLVEHICEEHVRNRAEKLKLDILLNKLGLKHGEETSRVEKKVQNKVETSSEAIKVYYFIKCSFSIFLIDSFVLNRLILVKKI